MIHTDDCLNNQADKDFCLSKRGNALEEFPATVHACGSNKVTYVTKKDLLCAAKTKPGACSKKIEQSFRIDVFIVY
jgi:hypothetical protein